MHDARQRSAPTLNPHGQAAHIHRPGTHITELHITCVHVSALAASFTEDSPPRMTSGSCSPAQGLKIWALSDEGCLKPRWLLVAEVCGLCAARQEGHCRAFLDTIGSGVCSYTSNCRAALH